MINLKIIRVKLSHTYSLGRSLTFWTKGRCISCGKHVYTLIDNKLLLFQRLRDTQNMYDPHCWLWIAFALLSESGTNLSFVPQCMPHLTLIINQFYQYYRPFRQLPLGTVRSPRASDRVIIGYFFVEGLWKRINCLNFRGRLAKLDLFEKPTLILRFSRFHSQCR